MNREEQTKELTTIIESMTVAQLRVRAGELCNSLTSIKLQHRTALSKINHKMYVDESWIDKLTWAKKMKRLDYELTSNELRRRRLISSNKIVNENITFEIIAKEHLPEYTFKMIMTFYKSAQTHRV